MTTRTEFLDDDDDPWVIAPIVQRTVSANGAKPLTAKAHASVWDMAFAPLAIKVQEQPMKRKILKVERVGNVTKCVPIMTQDTDEWKEREQARRAKQRPPKPTRKYKSMSKKFQNLIG